MLKHSGMSFWQTQLTVVKQHVDLKNAANNGEVVCRFDKHNTQW